MQYFMLFWMAMLQKKSAKCDINQRVWHNFSDKKTTYCKSAMTGQDLYPKPPKNNFWIRPWCFRQKHTRTNKNLPNWGFFRPSGLLSDCAILLKCWHEAKNVTDWWKRVEAQTSRNISDFSHFPPPHQCLVTSSTATCLALSSTRHWAEPLLHRLHRYIPSHYREQRTYTNDHTPSGLGLQTPFWLFWSFLLLPLHLTSLS